MGRLAKVAHPEALAASDGPRARVEIVVPSAWLTDGARLQIDLPKLLPCDRCDGGGCDSCERSGAFRIDSRQSPSVELTVPAGAPSGVVIRLRSPFVEVEQLIVRVNGGECASKGVVRLGGVGRLGRVRHPWDFGFGGAVPALIVLAAIAIGFFLAR